MVRVSIFAKRKEPPHRASPHTMQTRNLCGITCLLATLSFATLHWPFTIAQITVPRSGRHFGNIKTEKCPATQMIRRTDESTYTYSVRRRGIFFLRGKMNFLNRGITEKLRSNCGKNAVNCGPQSPPPSCTTTLYDTVQHGTTPCRTPCDVLYAPNGSGPHAFYNAPMRCTVQF